MDESTADRNMLFGILALQLDFIDRDQLITAMHAWVLDKTRPLDEILAQQGESFSGSADAVRSAGPRST